MKVMRILLAVFVSAALLAPLACSNENQDEKNKTSKPEQQTGNTQNDNSTGGGTVAEPVDARHIETANSLIDQGVKYLISIREEDGGWSMGDNMYKPAITAMVLKALVQHPDYGAESPIVKKGFEVLLSYQQPNGGIYDPESAQQNYTTAIAVMALVAANDEQYKPALDKALDYLRSLQILPGSETQDKELVDENHPFVGGVSYGAHGRPDIDNLGMWMQAMHDAGVSGDDPAMQKALIFITRCQNRTESNPSPWAVDGTNDGGFRYAVAVRNDRNMGESKAGEALGGKGLRSYGTATYMGLKSLLYANVDRKDPRVHDAVNWIRQYWRLDCNPNMPKSADKSKDQSLYGLYFSYYILSKALRAYGDPLVIDMKGVKHNWRHELIEALNTRLREGGYWKNDVNKWGEDVPSLTTSYSVLALQETLKK